MSLPQKSKNRTIRLLLMPRFTLLSFLSITTETRISSRGMEEVIAAMNTRKPKIGQILPIEENTVCNMMNSRSGSPLPRSECHRIK